MTDLQKKSGWAGEAIGPAQSTLHRSLDDLPTDVTPGARQVAELTAWRTAQAHQIERVAAAVDLLEKLPDWRRQSRVWQLRHVIRSTALEQVG